MAEVSTTSEPAVAVVTGGGDLPSPFVIHAIIMSASEPVSSAGVSRALLSALQRAADWEIARLALPVVGTGAGGLSFEDAVDVLCRVLASHLAGAAFPSDVSIIVEREDEKQQLDAALRRRGVVP